MTAGLVSRTLTRLPALAAAIAVAFGIAGCDTLPQPSSWFPAAAPAPAPEQTPEPAPEATSQPKQQPQPEPAPAMPQEGRPKFSLPKMSK